MLRLSEKLIIDGHPLNLYQTYTSHKKIASGVHDNFAKNQGEMQDSEGSFSETKQKEETLNNLQIIGKENFPITEIITRQNT